MALFGSQYYYCPACGQRLYDAGVTSKTVLALCCSKECRQAWEYRYAASVLGKDALEELPVRFGRED